MFGDDPIIISNDSGGAVDKFSTHDYANHLIKELNNVNPPIL
jgi:hypothetical protein